MTNEMIEELNLGLRPETKKFLEICNQYLNCRKLMDAKYQEVDECHKIANYKIENDCQIISNLPISRTSFEYKSEFQQQAVDGTPAKSLAELYQAAEQILPIFESTLKRIVEKVQGATSDDNSSIKLTIAPLKGRDRAQEKAQDDYSDRIPGPEVTWLYDIVRASIAFQSSELLLRCLETIQSDLKVVKIKSKFFPWKRQQKDLNIISNLHHTFFSLDRFASPTLTGYRDVNVCIQLDSGNDGFKHVCEIQIHHQAIQALSKELNSHAYYEYFRRYFAGATGALQERLNDLQVISQGATMDESFLTDLLQETADEDRLQRLANLFDTQLCEHDWALRVLQRLLEIRAEVYGREHYKTVDSYTRLGDVLQKKGELDKAMEAYQQATSIFSVILNDHGDFSGTLATANSLIRSQSKLREALEAHDASLKSHLTLFDNDKPILKMIFKSKTRISKTQDALIKRMDQFQRDFDHTFRSGGEPLDGVFNYIDVDDFLQNPSRMDEAIASCRSAMAAFHQAGQGGVVSGDASENTAVAIHALEEFEKVLQTFHRALKQVTRKLVDMQSKLAVIYNNQAQVLQLQGDIDGALQTFQTSLAIKKKTLGEDNAQVAERYVYLGNLLELFGQREVALGRYEKALLIFTKTLGEEHSFVADTLIRLADVLSSQGRRDEAIQHYLKAIGIYKRTLGEEHLSIANACLKVGYLFRLQRNGDDALEMYQQALKIQKAARGEEDATVGNTLFLISQFLRQQGNDAEAKEMLEKYIAISTKKMSKENSKRIESELERASILQKDGNHDEAIKAYQNALDLSQEVWGSEHVSLIAIYHGMASVHSQQNSLGRAMMMHYKALGLSKKAFGEDSDPLIADTYMKMGETLLTHNRLEKALKMYENGVAGWKAVKGNEHWTIRHIYLEISHALRDTGHHGKAEEYRTKAYVIPDDIDWSLRHPSNCSERLL